MCLARASGVVGLVGHHQYLSLSLYVLGDLSQPVLVVWQGPYRGSSGPPSSRSWPSAHSLLAPGTDEDLDVLDVHPFCRLSSHGGGLVGDRSCTTYARDLTCFPVGRSAYLRLSAAGCRG